MSLLIYDIETIPLPDAELSRMEPVFEAPVNYKDPEKIAAAIAEKRGAWKERAALSPLTGRVAMIGARIEESNRIIRLNSDDCDYDRQEAMMLREFWSIATLNIEYGNLLVGFNSHGFDIPFLARRSWALGVDVPIPVHNKMRMPWVDLMEVFTMGKPGEFVSLDTVAKFFRVGQKTGSCLEVARRLRECPQEAEAYLLNDLELTQAVARRMGLESWTPKPSATY